MEGQLNIKDIQDMIKQVNETWLEDMYMDMGPWLEYQEMAIFKGLKLDPTSLEAPIKSNKNFKHLLKK